MTLKQFWAYFKVVMAHRYWAFYYCCKMGIPFLGFIHDISKLYPCEFIAYAHNFYNPDGSKRDIRDKSGAYNPADQQEGWQRAWLHHQKNKHHWQSWVLVGDKGELVPLPMPEHYCLEMVADWCAAGRVYSGKPNPRAWYEKNKDKLLLENNTRKQIEHILRWDIEIDGILKT